MMEDQMAAELASGKQKPRTTNEVLETILHWLRGLWSKYFLRQKLPASVLTTERHAKNAVTEYATARPATVKSFTDSTSAKSNVSSYAKIDPIAVIVPDQQEIQRRRDLVRTLFNDFWSGSDEKPAGFVDRLNHAEDYINERLAACGELWRLDAETRAMLSLPPGSNSPNKGKTA
jgi:hypothetical protein